MTSLNGSCLSSKKRKWEDQEDPQVQQTEAMFLPSKKISINLNKNINPKSIFDIELHLETPLPLEWQRCLDIQSGQIHFYNTRTNKRTSRDPRKVSGTNNSEPTSHVDDHHMSLELELNLPYDHSERKTQEAKILPKTDPSSSIMRFGDFFELDSTKNKQEEMVAMVCAKCNMLVMLCKASPTCPNCKFLHQQDQSPAQLLLPRLSLLC